MIRILIGFALGVAFGLYVWPIVRQIAMGY